MRSLFSAVPEAQGLYDPRFEHDACGVAFVADIHGRRSHRIVEQALTALHNLDHRGAAGAEPSSGDGAGITVQVPDTFLREVCEFALPAAGAYAVGNVFLPTDDEERARTVELVEAVATGEGLTVLGWRELPTVTAELGSTAKSVMPAFAQLFVRGADGAHGLELERRAYALRKVAERRAREAQVELYFPSLSTRTLVYKGMLTTDQLGTVFPDLGDPRFDSAIGLVHSRFSTNTFPSWPLAHPYRYIAHNGEINTIRGNRNWMRTREALLKSDLIPGELKRLFPICTPDASDSATFDEVLELLHLGGRSLPHAVLMMIPEAWENNPDMPVDRRAFYEFHANVMEAWDGPACVSFTDGSVIGAVLDRNGLRPGRWWQTADGLVVLGSESGVLDLEPATVVAKGRLQPGRMFLVDTERGEIRDDDAVKGELAAQHPYGEWLHAGLVQLDELPPRERTVFTHESVVRRQQIFGYSEEELRVLISPMAKAAAEPIGSMGTDTPVAVMSKRPRLLFDYFSELFAQVTNPPLDAIREELVTSLAGGIGPELNLLDPGPASCRQIVIPRPVIDNEELAKIWHVNADGDMPGFRCQLIDGRYRVHGGGEALAAALERVRRECSAAVEAGVRILILSDRDCDPDHAPIPSLLLTSAVHQHLVRTGQRTQAGLVVETGEAREVHHIALLVGYGAAAVNPYLAFETIDDLVGSGLIEGVTADKAIGNYVKALSKGVLKVMSKMGISTIQSYTGAQVFEAFGLAQPLVDEFFGGTPSRLGGIGLTEIAAEVEKRHESAYPLVDTSRAHRRLEVGGEYQWRREGELHLFNPETVFLLQHATRSRQYEVFQQYADTVDRLNREGGTLRGLFEFKRGVREPVPVDQVEPVSSIVTRFATGAMSYGSISAEAHETLAIAMNRLGGRSNSGEGGEDARRFTPDANGDSRRSAVKQIASGRFGVTSHYLVNADDLQIKISQGAKPGEGGQLPGYKVYPWIARTRNSTPGVGLISPPPHHDIYSIEDIAQLIHDLKNANPQARVHVKLVSEAGVGTVAAGVSKAHADVVLISGHDGGTGAAPLTSLKHAGLPWELGLADTQQTLLLNGLRDRITVQVDGAMKTGKDVVVAALLGAEEYGFATSPLIVSGCIMMRVCHLDTCPVGVATQNPVLRERFTGKPEFVVTFFEFIAQQVRELLASLGFRSLDEAIGHVDLLDTAKAIDHWKADGLDLTPILSVPANPYRQTLTRSREQDHGLDAALDNTLIQLCEGALLDGSPVTLELPVRNVNRTVGTMLGSLVSRRYGAAGLPDGTIDVTFRGSGGQSFGAFVPRGITLRLFGDTNDFAGKGLSGGVVAIRPDEAAPFVAEDNVVAGNVIAYGATGGEIYLRGVVGERFCVRNSGATVVAEGVGDHALEYMTGGTAVILGATGRNLGAGMSGGWAYVLDLDPRIVNRELVDLADVPADEADRLRGIVEAHVAYTDSPVAAALLADWPAAVARFTAVVPRDFRKVLEATRRAEELGEDVDEAVMAAAKS
ncbi:glutamate synthase (NADPH/NADH) large chain [Jatrophihabitans endophyticus]|uniref:Glutamate synthase (NADPH/NADH) large chain n=1 Tax=Jatrophihabitans endophyticus TaxID=1206085 RepID=A0A1M5CZW2_9ACTN|nr:glutamate synthase large subunit [Jatrophihabitans endophyticus]SHF60278.1 glutamate synthase (NADPH/NADH) large chain [Jatrophihabitans endophyticus]